MNELCKRYIRFINYSLVCSVISSLSIISCVFLGNGNTTDNIISVLFPLIFWIGLAAEQIMIWRANSIRRKKECELQSTRINKGEITGVGVFSPFKTKQGKAADICFLFSLIILIVLFFIRVDEKLQFVFISILVMSFRLHCILNGKNFRYKTYLSKRQVEQHG